MSAPVSPTEYDPDDPYTDERLEEDGYATGLDVWGPVDKAYGNFLEDGALANAQLWSLRQAIRAEVASEIEAELARNESDPDVTSGEAIWEQGGYQQGLRAAAGIARGEA